jgi:hypothetical protein
MTLTIFIVFLVGSALSLRFNFLILYPATIFAAVGTAAHSVDDGIGATMLMMALGAAAVQTGYLFGLIMHAVIASFGGAESRENRLYGRLGSGPRISSLQEPRIASLNGSVIQATALSSPRRRPRTTEVLNEDLTARRVS